MIEFLSYILVGVTVCCIIGIVTAIAISKKTIVKDSKK